MSRFLVVAVCLLLQFPGDRATGLQADITGEVRTLAEANRALEEELKLAGRAQIYLVLDLVEGALLIKGRGIELHRLTILHWQASDEAALGRTFRLQARPELSRPKLAPGEDPAETVIELDDMPAEYELRFEPNLVIAISPPATEGPWLWMMSRLREWTTHLASPPMTVRVRLMLSKEDARSFAWSIVDGMSLIIKRKAA
jgi:hypothetical protein